MAHTEIEACGALQHHQGAERAQAPVQQAVGHVLRQHSLNVGAVDGWKTVQSICNGVARSYSGSDVDFQQLFRHWS